MDIELKERGVTTTTSETKAEIFIEKHKSEIDAGEIKLIDERNGGKTVFKFYDTLKHSEKEFEEELKKHNERIKLERPEKKLSIQLPQDGMYISEFASALGGIYSIKEVLYYRHETQEVIKIGRIKVNENNEEITGIISVLPENFITETEKLIDFFVIHKTDGVKYRSMSVQTAKIVLLSDQFTCELPVIKRVFAVPFPKYKDDKLIFPKKGYDKDFMSWTDYDSPEIENMSLDEAKEVLEKVYGEFAFKEKQDKINAIAHLITPFCRLLFSQETTRSPLFIYMANRERAGKDYCAGVVSIVYHGVDIQDVPIVKGDKNNSDEEFRKRLLSIFKEGRSILHSSNNKGYLNSAELEALITKPIFTDRQLGKNALLEFPNTLVISLSANTGLTYTADLAYRSMFINLFLEIEDPNERNFKIPDLHGWVKSNRGLILSAMYKIVENWIIKGKPKCSKPFASFWEWMSIVGGILEAADIGIPQSNNTLNAIGGDVETENMKQLFIACYKRWGPEWLSKSQIFNAIQDETDEIMHEVLRDFDLSDRGVRTKFGMLISKFNGRILGGIQMVMDTSSDRSSRQKLKFIKKGDSLLFNETEQSLNNETEKSFNNEKSKELINEKDKSYIKDGNLGNLEFSKNQRLPPLYTSEGGNLGNLGNLSLVAILKSDRNIDGVENDAKVAKVANSNNILELPLKPLNSNNMLEFPDTESNTNNTPSQPPPIAQKRYLKDLRETILSNLKKYPEGLILSVEAKKWDLLYPLLKIYTREDIDAVMRELIAEEAIIEKKNGVWAVYHKPEED